MGRAVAASDEIKTYIKNLERENQQLQKNLQASRENIIVFEKQTAVLEQQNKALERKNQILEEKAETGVIPAVWPSCGEVHRRRTAIAV
jgi:predicted ribosome quality control (RQC) complex YloA/Tae2 family protein